MRDGFFDQDIQTELHQPAADFGMGDGGRRHHGRVRVPRQILQRRERRHALNLRLGLSPGPCQLGMLGLLNNAQVIAAERARAHHGHSRLGHREKASTLRLAALPF